MRTESRNTLLSAVGSSLPRFFDEWRPSAITLSAPVFPLAVLFGLNAVDELDRAAFAVLLPDIRDHFGLSDATALALVAATTIAIVLVELPLSLLADRRNRVRIATMGAAVWSAVWSVFSLGTGLAASVPMLIAMRIGAGGGTASIGTLAPAFLALVSLIAPQRVRSAAFSTMSLFAIPGLIFFLPPAGAVSDIVGTRASILALVPVSIAAGVILASASRSVADDIEAVRLESLSRVGGSVGQQPPIPVAGERRPLRLAGPSTKQHKSEEVSRYV